MYIVAKLEMIYFFFKNKSIFNRYICIYMYFCIYCACSFVLRYVFSIINKRDPHDVQPRI